MINEDKIVINHIREFISSIPPDITSIRPSIPTTDYTDDILPFELYRGTRDNIEKVADQINKSFYYGIYDGASVLMRKLVEMLLILCFHEIKEEQEIRTSNGDYIQLSMIINKAINNPRLNMTRNSKSYLNVFKEKGDLSAHNPFHISYKRDLEILQPKYRHLIQELLNLSGIIK